MAFNSADGIKENTTTTGNGDMYLNGAVMSFSAFRSALSDGDTFNYKVIGLDHPEWETGLGTYHATTNTFTRTTVYGSSNGGSVCFFSSGKKTVEIANLTSQASTPAINTNTQTGTTYTLVKSDNGSVLEMNNAGAIALTIPPDSSVAWPLNAFMEIFQLGAGQVTITAGAGVTLQSDGAKVKTSAQYATIGIRRRAVNTWVISGDLS